MPGAGESRLWEWRYWGWRTAAIVLWERGQGATLRELLIIYGRCISSPLRAHVPSSPVRHRLVPRSWRSPAFHLSPSPLYAPSLPPPPSLPSLPPVRPQRGRRSLTKYFRRPHIITRRGPPAPASPPQDPRHRHLLSNPRTPIDSYSFLAVPASTGPSFVESPEARSATGSHPSLRPQLHAPTPPIGHPTSSVKSARQPSCSAACLPRPTFHRPALQSAIEPSRTYAPRLYAARGPSDSDPVHDP